MTREERVFFRFERTGPPDGRCDRPVAPGRFSPVPRRNGIAKTQTQNCVACESIRLAWSVSPAWEAVELTQAVELTLGDHLYLPVRGPRP